jgi:hypothetical protein
LPAHTHTHTHSVTHTHTHTHSVTHRHTDTPTDRQTDKQTLHPSAPGSTESLKSQNFYQDKDVQNAAERRVNTAPSIPQPPIYAPPASSPRNRCASNKYSSSSTCSLHIMPSTRRCIVIVIISALETCPFFLRKNPLSPPKHSPAAKPRGSKARQCVMASIVPTLPPH